MKSLLNAACSDSSQAQLTVRGHRRILQADQPAIFRVTSSSVRLLDGATARREEGVPGNEKATPSGAPTAKLAAAAHS